VGSYHIRDVEGRAYLDCLYTSGEFGGGISTDAAPLAALLRADEWLYPALPVQGLIDKLAVGTCLLYEGDARRLDGGLYLRLRLADVRF
jgi:hypothetical protein